MARAFASNGRVYSNITLTLPFTFSCWFKPSSTGLGILMALNRGTTSNHYHSLLKNGNTLYARSDNATTSSSASVTGTITTGTWNHAVGVWNSGGVGRVVFLNGIKAVNNATRTPTGLTEINIGVQRDGAGLTAYFNGLIAAPAIWNDALTDEEVLSLAQGFTPDKIRPQNLVSYNLFDPRILDVMGNTWTNSNTSDSSDSPPLR